MKISSIVHLLLDAICITVYLVTALKTLLAYIQARGRNQPLKKLEKLYLTLVLLASILIIPALASDMAYVMSESPSTSKFAITLKLISRFLSDATLVVLMAAVCQTALALANLVSNMKKMDEEISTSDSALSEHGGNEQKEISLESLQKNTSNRPLLAKLLLVVFPGIIGVMFILADIVAFSMHKKRTSGVLNADTTCRLESAEKVIRGLSKVALSCASIIACVCITKFLFDLTTYYMYKFDPEELLRNPEKQAEEARLARMGFLFAILIAIESIFVGVRVVPQIINNWNNPTASCKEYSILSMIFRYIIAVKGIFQVILMSWYFSNSVAVVEKPLVEVTNRMSVEDVLRKYGITPEDLTLDIDRTSTANIDGIIEEDFEKIDTTKKTASSDTSLRDEDVNETQLTHSVSEEVEPMSTVSQPEREQQQSLSNSIPATAGVTESVTVDMINADADSANGSV